MAVGPVIYRIAVEALLTALSHAIMRRVVGHHVSHQELI